MQSRFIRTLQSLESEERFLNGGVLIAIISVFFPWISGEWFGGSFVSYSGFGFFTSFIGLVIFLLNAFVLVVTIVPLVGGPVMIRKRYRDVTRLIALATATILLLAALSVLTMITMEFPRMEVRFGIYVTLIGSFIALFFAGTRFYEQRRANVQEFFHHPEDTQAATEEEEPMQTPPPPPPPPPPEPEDHPLFPHH